MSRWRKLLRPSAAASLPTADVMQFEPLARHRLSKMAYDYVRSGGGDEISMRENRQGFERLQLAPNPRVPPVIRTVRFGRSKRVSQRPSARPLAVASAPTTAHVLGSVVIRSSGACFDGHPTSTEVNSCSSCFGSACRPPPQGSSSNRDPPRLRCKRTKERQSVCHVQPGVLGT
jgi:hypothetical protein